MSRFIRSARTGLTLLLSLVLFGALTLLACLHANHRFSQQLRAYVQENVVEQADKAELYSFNDATTQSYLVQEITRNLASLCSPDFFQVLVDCSAQVISFKGIRYTNGARARFTLDFYQAPETGQPLLQVAVFHRINWAYLLGTHGLLVLLVWLALRTIPKPIAPARATWIAALKDWGVTDQQAIHPTQSMAAYTLTGAARLRELHASAQQIGMCISPEVAITLAADQGVTQLAAQQLPWLLKGLELHPQQLDTALAIASSGNQLVFTPATKSIRLHGLDLTLADTPFFYFYWYALLRLGSDEGWYTNPAQSRPDLHNSHTLQMLFEKYGGHAKAASELQEKGLRAKTLDQNRSKIKDELVRQLGEELAMAYLFDVQRDARTARFNYRLSLAPEFIKVEPEDLALMSEAARNSARPAPSTELASH